MAESFAQLLHRFRTRRGLTKVELATAVGAHRQSVLDWEAGKRVPRDRARLDDLTQVLNLSADEAVQLGAAARQHPQPLATPPIAPGELIVPAAQTFTAPQRHQLRTPLPDFVGREPAIATLLGTLRQATRGGRVAAIGTVRGMGGVGKTELAILIANRLVDIFPDAQIVVPLRGTSADPLPPLQALRQIIDALMPGARSPDDLETAQACYQSVLHAQRVLILADDARDASQVRPLLPPAGSALLITSRVRFSLPGMATIDLEQLDEAEAVTLLRGLCDRVSEADAQALARVCGYLPLALRIVGGLLHNDPALKPAGYLAHPPDERQLRDPDDPQLDVELSLGLSYTALNTSAQRVFRQLGVLEADFAAEMALAVIETEEDIIDGMAILHLLLRRNLIAYDAARERWRLHDLLRALARRTLEAAGEAEHAMWRCARAAVAIAEETQAQYMAGGEHAAAALARFDAERPHIDMARRWADVHAGTPDGDQLLLDAALATVSIGELRYDGPREFIRQLERVLAAARRLGDQRAEMSILNSLGLAELRLGEARRAIPHCEQALALAHTLGDPHVQGQALNNLGNAYAVLGGARCALAYFEHYLAIAQALGNRRAEGIALGSLGSAYMELGEVQCAIEACQAACAILRATGDRREEGYALSYLARAQARQGDRSGMDAAFEQALALLRTAGDRWGEAECQWHFGLARVQQGKRAQALPLLRAAVAYQQKIGHARVAERAALLARLETEEHLPAELLHPWDFSDSLEMARYKIWRLEMRG